MLKLRKQATLFALGCLLLTSACATKIPDSAPEAQIPERVVIQTKLVSKPKPIVPTIEPLNLRDVDWILITPENYNEKVALLGEGMLFFAVTPDGYKNLMLNLSDIRTVVEKQQSIIAVYERSF